MRARHPHVPLSSSSLWFVLSGALRLGLTLAAVALASGCGTAQSALPFIPSDAPLRYSTYLNPQGQLRGEDWALALMGHPSHREQVFLQAQQGLLVRRPGHPLYGHTVQVSKVHLVYEARGVGNWQEVIQRYCATRGVEVHFE